MAARRTSRGLVAITAALTAVTFGTPAAARTGNDLIKACHGVFDDDKPEPGEAIDQGYCMGAVSMLMQLGATTTLKFCPPANATVYQGVRVVLKFMDATPERLNEQFIGLAVAGLRQAWPCALPH